MKCHQAREKLRCAPLAEFLKGGTYRQRKIVLLNNDQEAIPQITGQIVETGVQNAREQCLTKQNKDAGVLGCQRCITYCRIQPLQGSGRAEGWGSLITGCQAVLSPSFHRNQNPVRTRSCSLSDCWIDGWWLPCRGESMLDVVQIWVLIQFCP